MTHRRTSRPPAPVGGVTPHFASLGLAFALVLSACGGIAEGPPSPTPEDLAILDGARVLLAGGAAWNHDGDRFCTLEQDSWNLFCALWRSSWDVLGTYQHRRPALEAVRKAIEEVSGRDWPHRLQDFNNDPATTFDDIEEVLLLAGERVRSSLPPVDESQSIHMVRRVLVELRSVTPPPSLSTDEAEEARAGHFAQIARLERSGLLIVAGPVEREADTETLQGVLILRTGDPAAAFSVTAEDPAVQAGLLRPVVRTIWLPAGLSWPNPRYPAPRL